MDKHFNTGGNGADFNASQTSSSRKPPRTLTFGGTGSRQPSIEALDRRVDLLTLLKLA